MPRHGAPTGAGGLREPLTPGPGRRNSLTDSVSDLRDSVSELSESLSEFVDTALHIEDQLVEEEPPPPGALTVETRIRRRCPTREGAMVWAAIGLLTAVSVYFTMTGELGRLLKAVQDAGLAGAILLILVYAVCMVILVPGTILNVGAGFIYKSAFLGYVVTILGCMLGAVACFALGRKVVQRWVQEKVAENGPVARLCKLMGASQMTERETFTIVLVSRLPPVMPFALTNYAFAITDVSFPVYFFGTLLGVSPACLLDAYIGSLCNDLASVLGGGEEADGSDDGAGLEKAKQFEIVFGVVLTIFATTVLVVHGNRVYSRLQAEAERENEQRTQSDTEGQQQPSLAPTPTPPTSASDGGGGLSSIAVSRPASPVPSQPFAGALGATAAPPMPGLPGQE
jgi:uncharacterized membrane protein YdjX (TVP38/TMEM64 family)